jgi:beta-lactamase class A
MKKLFFIPLFLFFCFNIQAQKVEIKLQKKIEALVKGFNGQIGVYVKSLETGKFASID